MGSRFERHLYRLHLEQDGVPHDVEFEARGSDIALGLTGDICGDQPVVMFEDGKEIATVKRTQGVWRVDRSAGRGEHAIARDDVESEPSIADRPSGPFRAVETG